MARKVEGRRSHCVLRSPSFWFKMILPTRSCLVSYLVKLVCSVSRNNASSKVQCAKILRREGGWNQMYVCPFTACKLKSPETLHSASVYFLTLLKKKKKTLDKSNRHHPPPSSCLRSAARCCLSSMWRLRERSSYLLQIASASSEPSAHSGSPSQRQRAGTHCPFLQAKSVVAHVFLAAETREGNTVTLRASERVNVWMCTACGV